MFLRRALCSLVMGLFGLCVLIVARPSQADDLPPWLNSLDDINWKTGTPDECWAYATWYLDRQDNPEIWQNPGYILLPYIIYDLAYPYINPHNDNPEMAVALAERVRIGLMDAKEVILADLKYSPHGIAPDRHRYDDGMRKTALFLSSFGGNFMFPIGAASDKEIDTGNVLGILTSPESLRVIFFEGLTGRRGNSTPGDEGAVRISADILKALPRTVRALQSTPSCDLLEMALKYWAGANLAASGTDQPEQDRELAEVLLRTANRIGNSDGVQADIYFHTAQLMPEFMILDDKALIDDFYGLSGLHGHPLGALKAAKIEAAAGNLTDALQFAQVAALQGIEEAHALSADLQKTHSLVLSQNQVDFALSTVSNYKRTRCHARSSP